MISWIECSCALEEQNHIPKVEIVRCWSKNTQSAGSVRCEALNRWRRPTVPPWEVRSKLGAIGVNSSHSTWEQMKILGGIGPGWRSTWQHEDRGTGFLRWWSRGVNALYTCGIRQAWEERKMLSSQKLHVERWIWECWLDFKNTERHMGEKCTH